MTRPAGLTATRTCTTTGFGLIAAEGRAAWRVAKDEYVATSGITSALVRDRVGPLPPDVSDSRGRYDTVGRTVYFADSRKTAVAEVTQSFRAQVMSMTKDAVAIGQGVDAYRHLITAEMRERGLPGPGEIPLSWQMARSLYRVRLPTSGWWVLIDCPETLNALSATLRGAAGQLTMGDMCGDDRGLTTRLAQTIRDAVLDDGSPPLGIYFPSKTAYGRCYAWWNRPADDNLNPSRNDPKLVESVNVSVPELAELCHEWNLTLADA